jgi:endonuclease/exonuclease/phosphatase family metal-dependent hydrolase
MKVLTLNINFKGLTPARIQKILALILHHNPDIIFLQEVPHQMVDAFQHPDYPYRFGEQFLYQYNTLILSRFPCIRYDRFPLPLTQSNRNLLLAQIILPSGKQINVGTFHAESVFNPPESEVLKMDQLRFIFSLIPRTPHSIPFIIAGDTNLLDNRESGIDNEQDSPPTFNKNRFDRIFTNLFVENSPILIGDATHSDHRGLVMSINLPEQ